MRQATLVYFNRRLCALECTGLSDYNLPPRAALLLWWEPLSMPTARYSITNWLGSWNDKQELVDDWDGKEIMQYPGYSDWHFNRDTRLAMVESNGKRYATATAAIPYPQPKVPATVEIRWDRDTRGNGCWKTYNRSKGWVEKYTRFFVQRTNNPNQPYQGLFQYQRGENWISYSEVVDINKVAVLVPEAQIKEVNS